MWCWVGNRHVGWDRCGELHVVCSGAVQCDIYICMCAVPGRVCDQRLVDSRSNDVHDLCCGTVQLVLNCCM